MNAVAAVALAFGSIGFVTAVLTAWSTHRLAAFQDVDGPARPSSRRRRHAGPRSSRNDSDAVPVIWQSSSDATLGPTPLACS